MANEICETCRFSTGAPSTWDSTIICRRFPPSLPPRSPQDTARSTHPKVHRSDWCGEFSPAVVTANGGEPSDG